MKDFAVWILVFIACQLEAQATLRTTFIEDVCFFKNTYTIDLRYYNTGILMSVPRPHQSSYDCTVILQPQFGSSVVLSIYKYDVEDGTELTIEDSDNHKIALVGWGMFSDERKSILSEGKMTIRYRVNSTNDAYRRQMFQFTFTQVFDSPCAHDEFLCRNGKCIGKKLACDGHNHCGDLSDQKHCVPAGTEESFHQANQTRKNMNIVWIISISIAGVILLIVIIVFIVVLVRRSKAKKAANRERALQTVSSAVPQQISASNLQRSAPSGGGSQLPQPKPSVFSQVRRSLRGHRIPKVEEVAQKTQRTDPMPVPSMYPQIPSAPELEGIQNPEFKIEE